MPCRQSYSLSVEARQNKDLYAMMSAELVLTSTEGAAEQRSACQGYCRYGLSEKGMLACKPLELSSGRQRMLQGVLQLEDAGPMKLRYMAYCQQ